MRGDLGLQETSEYEGKRNQLLNTLHDEILKIHEAEKPKSFLGVSCTGPIEEAQQAIDDLLHQEVQKALDLSQERMLKQSEELVTEAVRGARLEENAWSRQQMIAAQPLEAPNSGFGRMIKWSISLFNNRKFELLAEAQLKNKEGSEG